MTDGLDELRQFVINIDRVVEGAYEDVDAVVTKGAVNMKREMIADVSSSPHFKGMAGSITFEHENTRNLIRRVVGPDKGRPGGSLGNIYYFGTSRGGGTGDIEKPLRSEEPRVVGAMEALVSKWAGQL